MMRQFVGSSPMVGGEISSVCGVVVNSGSEGTVRGLHMGESALSRLMRFCVCSGLSTVM